YTLGRIPSSTFYKRAGPTNTRRIGDCTGLSAIRDPLTIQNGVASTGTPFAGNVIPASRINPTAKLIQDTYIPAPNQGNPNATLSNFGFLHPWATDLFKWDSVTGRIDHRFHD